jgi:hypothetical protein
MVRIVKRKLRTLRQRKKRTFKETFQNRKKRQSGGFNMQVPVVVSLTTTPSRINQLERPLNSIINQSYPIKHIEINIPDVFKRTGERYVIPQSLKNNSKVKIFKTDDYGPITKIGPTLLRYASDTKTYIWSVDDDREYDKDDLKLLMENAAIYENTILGFAGGKFTGDNYSNFALTDSEVDVLEGYLTILYPPSVIKDDFKTYMIETSKDTNCGLQDDIVLGNYFHKHSIHLRSVKKPTINAIELQQSKDKDALHMLGVGNVTRANECKRFLVNKQLWHITNSNPSV